jgi:predicted nuclease of restriction endonuclease-like (RecB) superfamily
MAKNQKKIAKQAPVPSHSEATALNFDALVTTLVTVDTQMRAQTSKAVNMGLTIRNWLYGIYILLYEQNGSDRAAYGEQLLDKLSKRLKVAGCAFEPRTLRLFRQFAKVYPQIGEALVCKTPSLSLLITETPIWQSLIAKSDDNATSPIWQPVIAELALPGKKLLEQLSFTALAELIQIDDPLKRAFYELESIRGNWSVRELRRQIATLLYERTGLSTDKKAVVARARGKAEQYTPAMVIRDPYVFEFFGLKPHEALDEANLESLLLSKLQDFLLELGHGFCFEGRRKRILIGDEYYFVDLVFYHRILKCHVLIELKVDEFSHQHIGQLNTYVSWYKAHMMQPGDNPPIGILLCTKKSKARKSLVEYALVGMDNQLFVSRYAVKLPKKEDIERALAKWAEE